MAEVDYRQEAAAQTAFAEEFRDDPDFAGPGRGRRSPTGCSCPTGSTGTPLAQVARSGSHSERERARCCTRFLLSSPPRVGRLHGDPHPGNFRLLDDGRLGVLDFGSSLPMPHGWPPRLAALLRAGRDRDAAALLDVATATGMVAGGRRHPGGPARPGRPAAGPAAPGDRSPSAAPGCGRRRPGSPTPVRRSSRTQRKLRVPVRHLLVQRVAAGTAGVLCLLGAPVAVRDEVAAWLPGLGPTGS